MAAFSENNAMGVLFITILFSCLGSLALSATTGSNVKGTTLPAMNGTQAVNVTVTEPDDNGIDFTNAHLNCRCSSQKTVRRIKINHKVAEMYYRAKMNATLGSDMKNYHFLTKGNCTMCTLHYMTCHGEDETYFLNCIRRTVKFSRIPRTLLLKKTGKTKSKTIVKRSPGRTSDFPIAPRSSDFNFESVTVKNEKLSTTNNFTVKAGRGKFPNRRIVKKILPNHFHVPVGGKTSNGTRIRRALGACMIPILREEYNAEFLCSYGEDRNGTVCVQRCAWGHTLPTGRITEFYRCSDYSRNIWEPHAIRPCEAFVDCGIELISPGLMECSPTTIKEGPTCKITCEHYEDKDALPEDAYTCNIDGQWSKKLPFCVTRSAAYVLVEPPNTRLHDEMGDPVSPPDDFVMDEVTHDL